MDMDSQSKPNGLRQSPNVTYKKYVQIAPMLAVTDTHFRSFIRGITCHAELWTEMHVDSTLTHASDIGTFLDFEPYEHPIVCQIGGNNSQTMAEAASLVAKWGYDGVNINCGCPSNRVSGEGRFGASLMKEPETVAAIVSEIHRYIGTALPISVKCRTGVDNDYHGLSKLSNFVETVSKQGYCNRFIIHARKAWLSGVNPKKNRSLPPLEYHTVYQLAEKYPHLRFSLNGGVSSIDSVQSLLRCFWRPDKNSKMFLNDSKTLTPSSPLSQTEKLKSYRIYHPSIVSRSEASHLAPSGTESSLCNLFSSTESTPCNFCNKHNIHTLSPVQNDCSEKNEISYQNLCEMMDRLEAKVTHGGMDSVLDGTMIGRIAFNHPCEFSCTDSTFYGTSDPLTARSPRALITYYRDYLDKFYPDPTSTKSNHTLLKPVLGLLSGKTGSRAYRQKLDTTIKSKGNKLSAGDLLLETLDYIDEHFPGSLDMLNITCCVEPSVVDTRDWHYRVSMRFRGVVRQESFSILANVINAFHRVAKLSRTGKEMLNTLKCLELRLSPTSILIRYCNITCSTSVHAYAYFEPAEIFREYLVESRNDNVIGLTVNIKCLLNVLQAGLKAYHIVVKLARTNHSRYLSFQFSLHDKETKSFDIYKDCLIELLPGRYAKTIAQPSDTLTGYCVELRSLQSIRTVIEQMRRLSVEILSVDLRPSKEYENDNSSLDGFPCNQQTYELEISTKADLSARWETFHHCILHTFEDSQSNRLSQSSHNLPDCLPFESFSPQSFLLKNIYLILQFSLAISHEFVLLKFVFDECVIFTFPLLRMQHAHATCITCTANNGN